MKGAQLKLHPDEEQLLGYLDGELSSQAASDVRLHLEACWQCRAALDELQNVVSECVQYRKNVLQRHLPAPPAPWVDIRLRFDEMDAALEPAFFGRLAVLLKSPFDSMPKRWAAAALALLVFLGLVYKYRQMPSVQAATLLRKAVAEANLHSRPRARIQIRTSDRRVTRAAVMTRNFNPDSADADTLNSLQALFERATYDWNDPLSARSFEAWRDRLADKSDRVGEQDRTYRIETSTASSVLRQAVLTLRREDLRPLEARLEFSDAGWIEITEAPDNAAPATTSVAENAAPSMDKPGTSVRGSLARQPSTAANGLASAGDELHVLATLHDLGADLGEPVEISRSGGNVLVSGVGIAPSRRQEIEGALAARAHVVVRFSNSPPASAQAGQVAAGDNLNDGAIRSLQNRLAEQLGGRANLDQLAAQVLDSSESMMARAYALRRLAEEFPVQTEMELNAGDKQLLRMLRQEHAGALRGKANEIELSLRPILGAADSEPTGPVGSPAGSWQAATEELFQSARRLDKLLAVVFGAAPSDISAEHVPAQLKNARSELRSFLDNYPRSDK